MESNELWYLKLILQKKVAEYDIVSGKDRNDLKNRVNGSIKEGWQPFGGPLFIKDTTNKGYPWCQAMVKCKCEGD